MYLLNQIFCEFPNGLRRHFASLQCNVHHYQQSVYTFLGTEAIKSFHVFQQCTTKIILVKKNKLYICILYKIFHLVSIIDKQTIVNYIIQLIFLIYDIELTK